MILDDSEYGSAKLFRGGQEIASGPVSEVKTQAQPGDNMELTRHDGTKQQVQAVGDPAELMDVQFIMLPLGPPGSN